MVALLETVILTANVPDHHALAGDIGPVVAVYTTPQLANDIKFVNPDGTTRALLTLAAEQVRRISASDVLTARQIPLAA